MIEIKYLADCKQHIPYLAELWYEQISKLWVANASIERAHDNLIKHAHRDLLPFTLVALEDDKPVGMASLREQDGLPSAYSPWLGSLVVDPLHRQQKIGETLIEAVKEKAATLGYSRLYLFAFDATIPQWYARLGWELIGREVAYEHPVTVMKIHLRK